MPEQNDYVPPFPNPRSDEERKANIAAASEYARQLGENSFGRGGLTQAVKNEDSLLSKGYMAAGAAVNYTLFGGGMFNDIADAAKYVVPDFAEPALDWTADVLNAVPNAAYDMGLGINRTLDLASESLIGVDIFDDRYFEGDLLEMSGYKATGFGKYVARPILGPIGLFMATGGLTSVGAATDALAANAGRASSIFNYGKELLKSNFWSKGAGLGAFYDFVTTDPEGGTITDMVVQTGIVDQENFLNDMLGTDPEDPWYVNKLKGAVEGAFAGAILEPALDMAVMKPASKLLGWAAEKLPGGGDKIPFVAELNQDSVRTLAEEGKLTVEEAEAWAQGKLWEMDRFKLNTPGRLDVTDKVTEAYGKDDADQILPIMDRMFSYLAAQSGKTLEDVYKLSFAGVNVEDIKSDDGIGLSQLPKLLMQNQDPNATVVKVTAKPQTETAAKKAIDNVNTILKLHPDAFSSEEKATAFMTAIFGDAKDKSKPIPRIPYGLIRQVSEKGYLANIFRNMSDGQRQSVLDGRAFQDKIFKLYSEGKITAVTTSKLALWGILSRMLSPYPHEAAAIDAFVNPKLDAILEKALKNELVWREDIREVFDEETVFDEITGLPDRKPEIKTTMVNDEIEEFLKTAIPAGSPGKPGTANLNAFGRTFLYKMSRTRPDGRTHLQYLHDLVSDVNMSGPDKRDRILSELPQGHGIGSKVHSFMLFCVGHNDLVILDRVQGTNIFKREGVDPSDYNYYDGKKVPKKYKGMTSAPKPPTLEDIPENTRLSRRKKETEEQFAERVAADKKKKHAQALEKYYKFTLPEWQDFQKSVDSGFVGDGLSKIMTDFRIIPIYKAIESKISSVMERELAILRAEDPEKWKNFVPDAKTWHWLTWNAGSGQAAGHSSLSYLYDLNKMIAPESLEARYAALEFGNVYNAKKQTTTVRFPGPDGSLQAWEMPSKVYKAYRKQIAEGVTKPHFGPIAKSLNQGTYVAGILNDKIEPGLQQKPWYDFIPEKIESTGRKKNEGPTKGTREYARSVLERYATRVADADAAGPSVLHQSDVEDALGQPDPERTARRGRVRFLQDTRAVVDLFKHTDPTKSYDKSTMLHEVAHIFRRQSSILAPEFHAEMSKKFGVKNPASWSEGEEELFAEGFEKYLSTGEAPVPELKSIFEKMKGWFQSIYNGVINSPLGLSLTQQQRDVYDAMLGKGWNRANPGRSKPGSPTRASVVVNGLRKRYIESFERAPKIVGGEAPQFDEELSKRIADAYDAMPHAPNDPNVRKAYDALAEETMRQYEFLKAEGYRMVPAHLDKSYSSAAAMIEDLDANKRLYVYKSILDTEKSFGKGPEEYLNENLLLRKTGEVLTDAYGNPYEVTVNDVFRFVHDVFGHASDGVTFGPKGEERAWLSHASMFSREALPAMTSETRGQNSWVNSGAQLRRADGSLPKEGDPDWKHPKDREYAAQKSGIMDPFTWDHPNLDDPADAVKFVQRIKETFDKAMKNATSTQAALEYSLRQHINFSRIETTEDVEKLMRMYEPLFGALRLPHIKDSLTLKEIEELGKELALKPNEVIGAMSSNVPVIENLAKYMVAMRIMQNSAAIAVKDEATKVALKAANGLPLTVADRDAVIKADSAFRLIGELRARMQRGAAVTVTSGRIAVKNEPGFDVDAVLTGLTGEGSAASKMFLEEAREAARVGDTNLAKAFQEAAEHSSVRDLETTNLVRKQVSGAVEKLKRDREIADQLGNAAAKENQAELPDVPNLDKELVTSSTEGAGPGMGPGLGPGAGPGMGPGAGPGMGPGLGPGAGPGMGPGAGPGAGPGMGPGAGPGAGPGMGPGAGPGAGPTSLPTAPTSQLTAQQQAQLVSLCRALVNAASVNQTGRASRAIANAASAGSTALNVLLEHHKAFLLSGVPTFAVNAGSGALMTAMQPLYRLAGAMVELDPQEIKNSFRLMAGIAGSLADMFRISNMTMPANLNGNRGLKAVYDTVRSETNTLTKDSATEPMGVVRGKTFIDQTKPGIGRKIASKVIDVYGRTIRLPFTFNQSAEEFFNQINYNAFIRMKALDSIEQSIWNNPSIPQGQKKRAAELALDKFMRDAYDNMGAAAAGPANAGTKFLHNDAVQYAKSAGFAQDLSNGVGQWVNEGVEKFPIFKLILPFVKAPTNLIRHTVSLIPGLGFAELGRVKSKLAGMPITSQSRDELLRLKGQMLIGAAFCGYAGYLIANGKITGNGPTNKEERNVLLSSGWRPYSFVVEKDDGTIDYVEYRRADPYSSILGLVADFIESRATLDDDEADSAAARIVYSLGRNLTSKTYLQGLSQFFDALVDGKGYAAQKWVQSFTGSFVPAALARYTQAVEDPTIRETREWYDGVLRRLPGYSETLPPRRNILGEVTTPNPGWVGFNDVDSQMADRIGTFVSPIGFSKRVGDRVKEEMASLRYGFSAPQYMMGDIDLRRVKRGGRDAYDIMFEKVGTLKIDGKTLNQMLEKMILSKEYRDLPRPMSKQDTDNPRIRAINGILASYRAYAKAEMLKQFPEVVQAYNQTRMNSATGQSSIDILRQLENLD